MKTKPQVGRIIGGILIGLVVLAGLMFSIGAAFQDRKFHPAHRPSLIVETWRQESAKMNFYPDVEAMLCYSEATTMLESDFVKSVKTAPIPFERVNNNCIGHPIKVNQNCCFFIEKDRASGLLSLGPNDNAVTRVFGKRRFAVTLTAEGYVIYGAD